MKNICTFILLVFALYTPLMGQITITDTYFPSGGDSLVTATANAGTTAFLRITPASATAQTWDYSYLRARTATARTVERFRSLSTVTDTAILRAFPGADLVIADSAGQLAVYNKTTTRFELLGFYGAGLGTLNLGLNPVFVPASLERRANLLFNSTNNNRTGFNLAFSTDIIPDTLLANLPIRPDSMRIRFQTNRQDKVDAWGKIKIPGSGEINCLRERRYEITETKIEMHIPRTIFWLDVTSVLLTGNTLPKDTTIVYNFWSPTAKEPLVSITTKNDTNAVSVDYKWLPINTPTVDTEGSQIGLKVYPNPVKNVLFVEINNVKSTHYAVRIFNIFGQQVLEKNIENSVSSVDMSTLSNGTYFLSVFTEGGQFLQSQQIIVHR